MPEAVLPRLTMPLFDSDEARWQAVRSRNASADGLFVYCVRSTRIYCRPICKARLARRANVSFHGTPREAREAGFRACKRCRPDVEGGMPEDAAVGKIRAFVNGDSSSSSGGGVEDGVVMSLGQMARRTGLSKWHFHRVFKKCVGVTPVEYVRMRRSSSRSVGPTEAESPQQLLDVLDMGKLDFAALDPVLADEGSGGSGGEMANGHGDEDMSWTDLLAWPDDDLVRPD
ncbi:hypothetical protein ACO1O0_003964 [Amphichorda felina]